MTKLTALFLALLSLQVFGQVNLTEQAQPIVAEGKRLYQSEMASWYGTDLFLAGYKDRANIGGYFSYIDNTTPKCIFFSKANLPRVIGTISFDSTYDVKRATTDLTERDFTSNESDLYTIRNAALKTVNSDTLFKAYKNTMLNLIPLITGNEKKVYILTGTSQHGVVIFGNDYLLTFDNANHLISKRQLHRNIIPVNYGGREEEGKEVEGTMHSHAPETGDFITSTDICTLLLYGKFAKWKQHNVISKKYLNIWNCKTEELIVFPMSTIEKINKDQEQKDKEAQKGN